MIGGHLLPISARAPAALAELAHEFARLLEVRESDPGELCAAAAMRRDHHRYRLAAVGVDGAALRAQLSGFVDGAEPPGLAVGERPRRGVRCHMLFPELPYTLAVPETLRTDGAPAFRDTLAECEAAASQRGREPGNGDVQLAYGALWKALGVAPVSASGSGAGAVVSRFVVGALGFEAIAQLHDGASADDSLAAPSEWDEYDVACTCADPERLPTELPVPQVAIACGESRPEMDLLAAVAQLYAHGVDIEWRQIAGPVAPSLRLPTYPWQKRRFWYDDRPVLARRGGSVEVAA